MKLLLLLLATSSLAHLGRASDAPEDDETDVAECYPAFDYTYTKEFYDTTKECQYKQMPKIRNKNLKKLIFREIKNPFKRIQSKWTSKCQKKLL